MTMMSKTRTILEGLVRDGSFKGGLSGRSSFNEEFEEMSKPPSERKNWISELSSVANLVVRRCALIINVSVNELQHNFNSEASDSIKHPSCYARNFLEYCCFRALAVSSQVTGHLADKSFRCLMYDMMIAWDAPDARSLPLDEGDAEDTVSKEAFCRIAPAIPTIADSVTSSDMFDALTASSVGCLSFSVYEKYIGALERMTKRMKTKSESSLLSDLRFPRWERILDVDGTVTTQPVLQHVGNSTWPGRLILTDHALYFEPLKVVSFDKAKLYDLSDDLKQIVKPELTGPWGSRLFDKAVMYKSTSIPEPVIMEFPELTGHSRRDYWLAIIQEILYAHKFIREYQIKGVEKDEALSKAVLGILRLQAVKEVVPSVPLLCGSLLMFNLADQLPRGDLILDTLADLLAHRDLSLTEGATASNVMYSVSSLSMLSNLGIDFGSGTHGPNERGLLAGEIVVGEKSALDRAVMNSRNSFKNVELAQATVDGVKVDGIDSNIALMKELLLPILEIVNYLLFLASWNDPFKSSAFCLAFTYIIYRGWIGHVFALLLLFISIFMLLTRCFGQGRQVHGVKVIAPPSMNTMEQLLALQNAISQAEEFVQDGNVVLLKLRALLFAAFPQATEHVAVVLIVAAFVVAILPPKYVVLFMLLEVFTRHSPPRKASTERWTRRLREWWFSIPAAPVMIIKTKEDKKSRWPALMGPNFTWHRKV